MLKSTCDEGGIESDEMWPRQVPADAYPKLGSEAQQFDPQGIVQQYTERKQVCVLVYYETHSKNVLPSAIRTFEWRAGGCDASASTATTS